VERGILSLTRFSTHVQHSAQGLTQNRNDKLLVVQLKAFEIVVAKKGDTKTLKRIIKRTKHDQAPNPRRTISAVSKKILAARLKIPVHAALLAEVAARL
jgi:hypothetical protein